jgi:H+-transporting ATPase
MELAVVLAAGLRSWIDFGVIIGILMLNAIVGWYQEKQAADVVASLKGDIAMRAWVIRNGQEEEILARELVPGDIVSVPAIRRSITGRADAPPLGYSRRRPCHPCRCPLDL